MSESYSTINPCNMCMPMGSVLAFRGIEGCMPLFHGSQGLCRLICACISLITSGSLWTWPWP